MNGLNIRSQSFRNFNYLCGRRGQGILFLYPIPLFLSYATTRPLTMAISKLLTAFVILAVMSLTSVVCFILSFSRIRVYININSGATVAKFNSLSGWVSVGTSNLTDGGTFTSKDLNPLNLEHPMNVSQPSIRTHTINSSLPRNVLFTNGSRSAIDTTSSKVSHVTRSPPILASPSIANKVNCHDKLCSEYLSKRDHEFFQRCQLLSRPSKDIDANPNCHFMNGAGRDPVGLVSVPGSGNTWIRGLLERATGICTGSIYCDQPLRRGGFMGEYVQSGSVSVVKTHTSDYQWKGTPVDVRNGEDALYGSAILLIRNPYDTFVSEHNRLETLKQLGSHRIGIPPSGRVEDDSHVHIIGEEYFGENPQWDHFIHAIGERWKKTIDKWYLHPFNHSIMVVRYEDLKTEQVTEVKKMLDFLGIQYEKEGLYRRLQENYRTFQRKHHKEYEHYTVNQKKYMNSLLLDTIQMLQKHNVDHLFKLEQYIAPIL